MLQSIKNAIQKRKAEKEKKRFDTIFNGNRERFESIHADKRDPGLQAIYQRLELRDPALTDEEILAAYRQFSAGIQTNTFCAAELELVSISILCYHRPALTETLLRQGLKMILWSLGDDIDHSILKQFIDRRIVAPEISPYGGLPGKEGMMWLTEIIPNQTELIKKVLKEVIEQNNKELGRL